MALDIGWQRQNDPTRPRMNYVLRRGSQKRLGDQFPSNRQYHRSSPSEAQMK